MTYAELIREVNSLKYEALAMIYNASPKRTQALARSFKITETPEGFYIDTNIFYMKYVNELDLLRGGRANYNKGWFDRTVDMMIRYIESRLGIRFIRG